MIFLEFTNAKGLKQAISLHDSIQVQQINASDDTCIINDDKFCITYHPTESYSEIIEKLANIVHIA